MKCSVWINFWPCLMMNFSWLMEVSFWKVTSKRLKKIFRVMIILCHGKFQAYNGFLDVLCMYINKKDKLIEFFVDFRYIQNYYWCWLVWSLSSPCFSIHMMGPSKFLLYIFTLTPSYIYQILVMCVLLISVWMKITYHMII